MTGIALGGELAQLAADYEFIGELGRGGSAVVYHARDRGLGRDVAIKVVHPRPQAPGDDAVARLAREARTVAQLQHPNIVTVFAVRSLSGGGLALVMQLVPGQTLKALVQSGGPLPVDRCEHVLRDVASALAYAHARGIVHRDVKPENIFVDEQSGRALLSDFGIARSEEHDSLTMTGTAIGTPFYMSPEQIDNVAIDGRSDLYSLGLVAWEMLTGRRPWDGESLYNVIYKQKHEELPPIEALRPGVPPRLQYLVERMLQKTPGARWAGADALLAQLSHTILPGDYSRWQGTLRKRVERFHAAEKERARAAAATPANDDAHERGLLASTMRFVRGATIPSRISVRPSGGTHPKGAPALANTMRLPANAAIESLEPAQSPPLPLAVVEPLPNAVQTPVGESPRPRRPPRRPRDTVAPSWDRSRSLVHGRGPSIAIGTVLVAAVVTLVATPWGRTLRESWASRLLTETPAASLDPDAREAARAAASFPVPFSAGAAAVAPTTLALGSRHSCSIGFDGRVRCWGGNDRGQLGDGTTVGRLTPVPLAAQLTFATMAANGAQSCGVTRTGDAYCWGDDTYGQLGDATTIRRTAPVRVAGPGVYRSIAVGASHACAVTGSNTIDCWGANARGQLGDSSIRARSVPAGIKAPEALRFVQVVAGDAHSCGLGTDGRAYCWGGDDRGQLGTGGVGGDRRVATPVATDVRFRLLAAGARHTCGLTGEGTLWCWGANERHQLGRATQAIAPSPIAVPLPSVATAVVTGTQHTCALDTAGDAYCWGANAAGQLGIGPSVGDVTTPRRVVLPQPLTAIGAGARHTCGVSANDPALCWGENGDGQLGDATRQRRLTPVAVGRPVVGSAIVNGTPRP